jgi:hypothetical protein
MTSSDFQLMLPALWKEEQEKVNLMVGAASCIVEEGRGQG